MELISHTRVITELRQTEKLDEKCHALIFDAQSGELFAWHSGDMSSLEAVSTAAVLYNTWGAQAETVQQHDDELQVNFLGFLSREISLVYSVCILSFIEDPSLFGIGYSLHSNH